MELIENIFLLDAKSIAVVSQLNALHHLAFILYHKESIDKEKKVYKVKTSCKSFERKHVCCQGWMGSTDLTVYVSWD